MKRFLKSLKYAYEGIKILVQEEPNYRIHTAWTFIVLICGLIFQVSSFEWCLLVIVISIVFVTETLNTSVENIMDFVSEKRDERIKRIKDLSAAAVLIAVLGTIVVGLIIFLPKLISVLTQFLVK